MKKNSGYTTTFRSDENGRGAYGVQNRGLKWWNKRQKRNKIQKLSRKANRS